ncbi:L-threonylcarbamoyladenylate synthase [Deinococcus budaensis]|uniref:L-threonylcarbamoyladenylate synthase n=1 Tax=Deinococcus budaensis TaxID=1665626 RepID=A0A7W8GCR2_9DEIO|nr:L-threonylcarbamoyladenylate synthase [Deinococcus budaensis]MBB5233169.1 L-threonylcarbamoyladenylate synthase [Deinococcus budaensis]
MKRQSHISGELAQAVAQAATRLRAGGVVGYPTETVWGLAAHPAHPQAVARLAALKGRDPSKPLQVSCLDAAAARTLVREDPAVLTAFAALADLWPGPLTLVLPAGAACPPALAPGGWVGLRVPDHAVALALLRASGGLLSTTSLNPAGQAAACTHAQAQAYALADLLLPPGHEEAGGEASTVVRVGPGGVEVLREGALPVAAIHERLRQAGAGGRG